MLDATIETSILNVNGDSLPGPLIIETFEKRAPENYNRCSGCGSAIFGEKKLKSNSKV